MLSELLEYWQPRLNLSDWDISVEWAGYGDTYIDDSSGCNRLNRCYRQSRIFILREEDFEKHRSEYVRPYDPERTLIHELLHCVMWAFQARDTEGTENVLQEQCIITLTDALLGEKRSHETAGTRINVGTVQREGTIDGEGRA